MIRIDINSGEGTRGEGTRAREARGWEERRGMSYLASSEFWHGTQSAPYGIGSRVVRRGKTVGCC